MLLMIQVHLNITNEKTEKFGDSMSAPPSLQKESDIYIGFSTSNYNPSEIDLDDKMD